MSQICSHCQQNIPLTSVPSVQCPFCDAPLASNSVPQHASRTKSASMILSPFIAYARTLRTVLLQPTPFFQSLAKEHQTPPTPEGARHGIFRPLAFALITHWLGSAFQYLWNSWIGGQVARSLETIQGVFQDVVDPTEFEDFRELNLDRVEQVKDQVLHWFWGAGSVIIDPFSTLFSLLFTSFFIWIGARILVSPGKNGAPQNVSYESALQIVCYSMAPAILGFIPLMGSPLSAVLSLLLGIIGAREVYRTGFGKATLIALFPKLLFFGMLSWILALGVLALVKFVSGVT